MLCHQYSPLPLAGEGSGVRVSLVPLYQEIPWQEPSMIAARFAAQEGTVFLESARVIDKIARYSFIAVDPFLKLTSKNGVIYLGETCLAGDPFTILQEQLSQYPMSFHRDLPPFQGGVAGYFGYELNQHLEKLSKAKIEDISFPDMSVGFYDVVLAFDHQQQRAWIFSSGYPEREASLRERRAWERMEWVRAEGWRGSGDPECELASRRGAAATGPRGGRDNSAILSNFSPTSYAHAVQQVIDYITAGDVFEVNLAQRFTTTLPFEVTPFDLYQRLRHCNPAPFSAYLNIDDVSIVSASPERFLKLTDNIVETRPIKGTRPRGKTREEDRVLIHELANSEKDRAENIMIVDLLRNDLSRVCQDHSVKVPQLCGLETYATVHHLVSIVTGKLRDDQHAIDLLRATFPGGSITGAPKVRAMEIIAELEPHQRGPYCGSIGYIGFNGDMDTSITIRTYAIRDRQVTFHAGGAVVLDSDPAAEYEETLVKARALRQALKIL